MKICFKTQEVQCVYFVGIKRKSCKEEVNGEWAILGWDWIYEGVTIYYFTPRTLNIGNNLLWNRNHFLQIKSTIEKTPEHVIAK